MIVTPERQFSAADVSSYGDDYLLGYRDGVDGLVDKLLKKGSSVARQSESEPAAALGDMAGSQPFTYGVNMVGAATSPFSGDGARVAILDSGIDFSHPAFAGRIADSAFFIGSSAHDGNPFSHGTHCAGTACGPQVSNAPEATRFGVAYDAELYIGKVLPDSGFGGASIYQGMQWAIDKKCHVISMSIQSDSSQVYPDYDLYGQRALNAGCLVVAAAGNNASRPNSFGFVAAPANALTIIAVGGIDRNFNMYSRSGRSNGVDGGNIDLAGPGVAVYSSIRGGYGRLDGTSMATPHVAGVAALWHQKTGATGVGLALALYQSVKSLSLDSRDVGKGLVQAPQS
ncbi:MAG: S8 family serine peptidase [Planctomycetes bacterium]|nr:S8 family serine peptidase [Planctomycetota bacterium]